MDKLQAWKLVKEELDRVTQGEAATIAPEELAGLLLLLLRQEPPLDPSLPEVPEVQDL